MIKILESWETLYFYISYCISLILSFLAFLLYYRTQNRNLSRILALAIFVLSIPVILFIEASYNKGLLLILCWGTSVWLGIVIYFLFRLFAKLVKKIKK